MKEAVLRAICEINPRKAHGLDPESECSFIPMDHVDGYFGIITKMSVRRIAEVEKGYTYFQDGDVLFAKITPCMENGKCAIAEKLVNGIGFGSTEFHVIRAKESVVPEWVYYYLRQETTRKEAERSMTGSAGQRRVPSKFLREEIIPLPPLPEQKRIAAILAKVDRVRRLRRTARNLSDTYLQSVFLEMFGDPVSNPMGWERAGVSDLGRVQTGNTPSRSDPKNYGSYIEWIKSDNIANDEMFVTRSREMLSEKGLRKGRFVEPGSILVTCIAGSPTSIGNIALTDRKVAFNQQINAVTPHKDVDSTFLYGLFRVAKPLVQRSTTLGMKRIITKSKFENLVLIKPPLPLQQEFAHITHKFERLRAQQREAERQAEHLFQTLLHRAFRGEL